MSNRKFAYMGVFSAATLACVGCRLGYASVSYAEERPVHVYHEEPVVVERVYEPVTVVHRGPRVTTLHRSSPRVVEVNRVDGSSYRVWSRARRTWIAIDRGHVHGPRCGHIYLEGRWSIHD